jgi:hypothetical protein
MSELVQWIATEVDERRSIAYSNLEVRAENEGKTIVGYAAVWDSPSEYMGFTEFVKRGAFSKTLNDGADVRLCAPLSSCPPSPVQLPAPPGEMQQLAPSSPGTAAMATRELATRELAPSRLTSATR